MKTLRNIILLACFLILLLGNCYSQIDPMVINSTLSLGYDPDLNKITCSYDEERTTITSYNKNQEELWQIELKFDKRRAFGSIHTGDEKFTFLSYSVESTEVMAHVYDYQGHLILEKILDVHGVGFVYFSPDRTKVFFCANREGNGSSEVGFSLVSMKDLKVLQGNFEFANANGGSVLDKVEIIGKRIFFREKSGSDFFNLSEYDLESNKFNRFGIDLHYRLLNQYTQIGKKFALFVAGKLPNKLGLIVYSADGNNLFEIPLDYDKLNIVGDLNIIKEGQYILVAGLGYFFLDGCLKPIGHFICSFELSEPQNFKFRVQEYDLYKYANKITVDSVRLGQEFYRFDRFLPRTYNKFDKYHKWECDEMRSKKITELKIDGDSTLRLKIDDIYKKIEVIPVISQNYASSYSEVVYFEKALHHYTYDLNMVEVEHSIEKKSGQEKSAIRGLNPFGLW